MRAADSPGGGKRAVWLAYASLAVSIASLVFVATLAVQFNNFEHSHTNTVSTSSVISYQPVEVAGTLIVPSLSLADAPVITTQQAFGSRLTDINQPLNSSELAVFNNASDSYYETAAAMFLNHTLSVTVGSTTSPAPLFIVNGKPTVVYLGAISCPYCAENRWAMALALTKFGSFSQLFWGYSALGDGDVPTIYWAPGEYNSTGSTTFGNFYQGKYVNFVTMEWNSPIDQAFQVGTSTQFETAATATNDPIYTNATHIMFTLGDYVGTPDTIWGDFSVPGVDAVNWGVATGNTNTTIPMASMTHEQILSSISNPTTPFAWTEYAAADWYIALICATTNIGAPVCSLPSISTMVGEM